MTDNTDNPPVHPLVDVFINSRPGFRRLAEQHLEGLTGEVVKATLHLIEAAQRGVSVKDAMLAADRACARIAEASGREEVDPNLLILMCVFWSALNQHEKRYAEASAIEGRMRELISPDTPPELEAMVLSSSARLASRVGRKDEGERLFREALATMPKQAKRFPQLFNDWGSILAWRGRFAEVEQEYSRVCAGADHDALQPWRQFIYLVHYVITGRVREVHGLNKESLENLSPNNVEDVRLLLALADLLAGRPTGDLPTELAAVRELLDGRAGRALELAREVARGSSEFLYGQDFQDFNLVRAELATGQAEAARRLIRLRRERGNTNYLDDFFLARAELLSGRREEAAALFSRAYLACRCYQALPRLEIEVRMALEMSPGDVMWLMLRAAESGGEGGGGDGGGVPHDAHEPALESSSAPLPSKVAPEFPERPLPSAPGAHDRGAERLKGVSAAMELVRSEAVRAAQFDLPVLITGETGVGKEMVARAIHECGPRAAEPFLSVNCGALAETLLESELFGHERGAFTGAIRAHRGMFEEAGGGTILLDEIGEISPRLQVALLRVVETGEVRPVGSARSRRIGCRVVAATNADLEGLVAVGRFRSDLLFRLRRVQIAVPPLRGRPGDILPLAEHFLAEGRTDGARPAMNGELKRALLAHPWPGNVRELRNEIERMRLMNSDRTDYGIEHLDPRILGASPVSGAWSDPAVSAPRASGNGSPSVAVAVAEDADGFPRLSRGRSPLRRLEDFRALFERHRTLTRAEAAATLGLSLNTATKYLAVLVARGFLRRVEPNASRRTHYFELAAGESGGAER